MHVEKILAGQFSIPKDLYRRRLVQVFLRDECGSLGNFVEKLAYPGYILSFYTTGIDVASAMRAVTVAKKVMLNLPERILTYPYLPWDL